MTVTSQYPNVEYQGDGVTTVFTFSFRLLNVTDLKVFVDTVQQVIYSDFVIENLTDNGGEVHMFLPPADGIKVGLMRATAKTQQIVYEPYTPFPAESNEYGLDRLTLIVQELEQRFIDNVDPQVFSFNGRVGDIIPDAQDYSQFYVNPAYGGVGQFVSVGLPDIGAGWVTLLFNSGVLNSPRHITQESTSNGIRFGLAGVYSANVTFTLTHAESNSGREIRVRLYNQTTDTGGTGTILGIARNQPATNFSTTLLFELDDAHVGDLLQIQIGDGDAVTGVTEVAAEFSVHAVSEYRG